MQNSKRVDIVKFWMKCKHEGWTTASLHIPWTWSGKWTHEEVQTLKEAGKQYGIHDSEWQNTPRRRVVTFLTEAAPFAAASVVSFVLGVVYKSTRLAA